MKIVLIGTIAIQSIEHNTLYILRKPFEQTLDHTQRHDRFALMFFPGRYASF
jgi:hypothetical protein